MRVAYLTLAAGLAACLASCSPATSPDALVGRWQCPAYPGLYCEFVEDGTFRIRGDFGQAIGWYTVEEDGQYLVRLDRRAGQDLPSCLNAVLRGARLTLEAPGGRQAHFRRG
jgi:hypothetical protein